MDGNTLYVSVQGISFLIIVRPIPDWAEQSASTMLQWQQVTQLIQY